MKKFSLLLIFSFIILSFSLNTLAKDKENVSEYVGGIIWKWYGRDWSTGKLPKAEVDSKLVEGVDYKRSYAITRNIVNNVSDLEYLSEEDALLVPQYPGSVCEKIEGIGNYTSEKVVCHVVYGYTYIKVNDAEKYEGEEDPTFTYSIVNYNNLEDDMSEYLDITIERVEGETIGEYELIPHFKLKDEDAITISFVNNKEKGSIQYVFKNLGRIIVEPQKAKLTIMEKTEEVISDNQESEVIYPPHTDIDYFLENNTTEINSYILFFDEKKKYSVY